MRPKRPLRSIFIGNPRYLSAYGIGVAQAMSILGHWHRTVSIFDDYETAKKQFEEMAPDVIWTHMALWPPANAAMNASAIASLVGYWKRRGSAVYLHDGDPRDNRRVPEGVNVLSNFSIALVNRSGDHWSSLPTLRWPYAAMVQKAIGEPCHEWTRDLIFAGHLREGGQEKDGGADLYEERTKFVNAVQLAVIRTGGTMQIICPGGGDVNNRMLVADVAPSATAILGFARPEVAGWADTRVFQYPGAGGVLVHDDADEFLEPDVHYLKFDRARGVDSVIECVERAKAEGPAIRERAFAHVQKHHTWVNRVEDALAAFYGR